MTWDLGVKRNAAFSIGTGTGVVCPARGIGMRLCNVRLALVQRTETVHTCAVLVFCSGDTAGQTARRTRNSCHSSPGQVLMQHVCHLDRPGQLGESSREVAPDVCRWEGRPLRAGEWQEWFKSQAEDAGASLSKGLYVGLRLDGRVRASGTGCPPWPIFAKQLAPMSGMWKGIFDGMDGRVGG